MRKEFNALGLADAGSGGHPPSASCRQAQAGSLLKSQEGHFNTRHSGEQTAEAKATLVTVPAPGPLALQHEEQQRKGGIYTGSLPGFASTFPP